MIKLGICNELFEDWDFAQICRTVKSLGYDGLEIAPFTLAARVTDLSRERRRELGSIVVDSGLETIGLHWLLARTEGLYLTTPDKRVRDATADYLVALAETTADLGGRVMVLGSPKQRNLLPGVSMADATGYAADVFERIMPAVAAFGVELCFEPLAPDDTDFVNSCAEAMALIRAVGHPNFTLHMDVKAQSKDPEASVPELIKRYSQFAGHFHAQDTNLKGPGMGSVDFGPIMAALVDSGYSKWVSVEVFDYTAGAEETARKSIECLKRSLDLARRSSAVTGDD
jgi:sugar phosphate isomerase/epimerase